MTLYLQIRARSGSEQSVEKSSGMTTTLNMFINVLSSSDVPYHPEGIKFAHVSRGYVLINYRNEFQARTVLQHCNANRDLKNNFIMEWANKSLPSSLLHGWIPWAIVKTRAVNSSPSPSDSHQGSSPKQQMRAHTPYSNHPPYSPPLPPHSPQHSLTAHMDQLRLHDDGKSLAGSCSCQQCGAMALISSQLFCHRCGIQFATRCKQCGTVALVPSQLCCHCCGLKFLNI